MAIWFNDALRALVKLLLPLATGAAHRKAARQIQTYQQQQKALGVQYGILPETPIVDYGGTRRHLEAFVRDTPDVVFAATSGSTGAPKRIPYTADRLRRFKAASREAGLRAFSHFGIRRPELFVFAGLEKDDSFSSLVLHDADRGPGYLSGLIEPARYLRHPALRAAMAHHGHTAARVFLLALANPELLYSTNPSTLAVFLTDVKRTWREATGLVRAVVEGERPDLDHIIRRVGRRGWRTRFEKLAHADAPPPLDAWAPDVRGFCCWDGGYVGPFIAQIRQHLPADRYVHIPMYAMSTETVETLPVAGPSGLAFLPISPRVFYEFLPAEAPDDPRRLLSPVDVEVGSEVCMVVSDAYGLRRYQTEDVFHCVGHIDGLPDLRFMRRRGLTWSFTGEKLTAIQLDRAYAALREQHPELADVPLSCLPTRPANDLPGYVLLVTTANTPAGLGNRFDAALGEINAEYHAKRSSGRLAAPRVVSHPYAAVAAALGGPHWESQFKLAPLTQRLFEEIDAALP